jgi:hypothetical protein
MALLSHVSRKIALTSVPRRLDRAVATRDPSLLEGAIAELDQAHGIAVAELKDAVMTFRDAYKLDLVLGNQGHNLLQRSWRVHRALELVRKVERGLEVLSAERRAVDARRRSAETPATVIALAS